MPAPMTAMWRCDQPSGGVLRGILGSCFYFFSKLIHVDEEAAKNGFELLPIRHPARLIDCKRTLHSRRARFQVTGVSALQQCFCFEFSSCFSHHLLGAAGFFAPAVLRQA
jgi:hypothetical protein